MHGSHVMPDRLYVRDVQHALLNIADSCIVPTYASDPFPRTRTRTKGRKASHEIGGRRTDPVQRADFGSEFLEFAQKVPGMFLSGVRGRGSGGQSCVRYSGR